MFLKNLFLVLFILRHQYQAEALAKNYWKVSPMQNVAKKKAALLGYWNSKKTRVRSKRIDRSCLFYTKINIQLSSWDSGFNARISVFR